MGSIRLTEWPHLYHEGKPDAPVLLMLHGTGSDEHNIAALAPELHPEAVVLAPRGRTQEHGALRWFARRAEGVFDVDDVIVRAGELADFITEAREQYGLEGRQLVAVGFSNGANIALATGMLHPDAVDRVIAFSGMYPFGDRTLDLALANSRFLTLNGKSDPMAPLASATHLVSELRRGGADVVQSLREGGHGIDRSDLAAAVDWLRSL